MSKIKKSQDVINSLRSLADSLKGLVGVLEVKTVVANQQEPESKAAESKCVSEPNQPTLEEVRAAMAEKNRDGYREAVKAIIVKYGANKLTALDPEHYPQVLKEVGEIK